MGRIVHFGLGNFARAHLLDYTADAGGWDVIGVSLRSGVVRDGLAAQGFGYSLCVQGEGTKQIDILSDVLVAPENPNAVFEAMVRADIISATVSEKGYHLDANGVLDLNDPAIAADLDGQGPTTLIGFLARDLAGRINPVTVMSCDNRVENGGMLRAAVARFAQAAGLTINQGIARFPNAMVDRITPATTDAVRKVSGDKMAVPTEAFREWVIEDNFVGPRPDWPDVQFVTDVAPHELRKLRMLNGAHSLMAYAGLMRGHVYVHQAVNDPVLRDLVEQLMAQAGATLPPSVRAQAPAYAKSLMTRFENPELAHRLDQIAMDGSQKVPYRFVGKLRAGQADAVAKGIKAWIAFCVSETKAGRALNDPKAEQIANAVRSGNPDMALLEIVGATDLLPLIKQV
jgi:fructuronate reductase